MSQVSAFIFEKGDISPRNRLGRVGCVWCLDGSLGVSVQADLCLQLFPVKFRSDSHHNNEVMVNGSCSFLLLLLLAPLRALSVRNSHLLQKFTS